MYIVQITPELAPIAKVGGLGDVVYGLSKEMTKKGHKVEVLLPRYDCIDYSRLKHLKLEALDVWSIENQKRYNNTVWSAILDQLNVMLLETDHPQHYFSRNKIYGTSDDNDRFLYFCRAALEFLFKTSRRPDVIHIHDWPTALVSLLFKEIYRPLGMKVGSIVYTIHNFDYQGKCALHNFSRLGLRAQKYLSTEELEDPFQRGTLNLMKGAIKYSDFLTTVSPNYAREIKTNEGGRGLNSFLLQYSRKFEGILNGIDPEYWDPAKDSHLIENYSSQSKTAEIHEAKKRNRRHLVNHLLMDSKGGALVAVISRLVPQKGPELMIQAMKRTLEKGGQFILLGASPIAEITNQFLNLQKEYANNKNVAICLDNNEAMAHLIYASADMIVIPSLFEPCGLTQMIAMRYGTIPIARATGGLVDTVFDVDTSSEPEQKRNGFTFEFPDTEGVNWALDRAIDCFMQEPEKWQRLMQNAMHMDFSWSKSADKYLNIYEKASTFTSASLTTSSFFETSKEVALDA